MNNLKNFSVLYNHVIVSSSLKCRNPTS